MGNYVKPVYEAGNPKTNRDWHVSYVYNDDDFFKDICELCDNNPDLYAEFNTGKLSEDHKKLPYTTSESVQKCVEIAKKWKISTHDFLFYIRGGWIRPNDKKSVDIRDKNAKDDIRMGYAYVKERANPDIPNLPLETIILRLSPDITYEKYIELWQEVKNFKKQSRYLKWFKPKRMRSTDNPELVYAIFKARQRGISFPAIFKQYQSRTLKEYHGSDTQYKSVESIKTFYYKFQPKGY